MGFPLIPLRPVVLIIRDGWGYRTEKRGNAVALASTPETDRLLATYPTCILDASGEAVGFPKGFMGTSEAGHLNIGAGRLVRQEIKAVDDLIASGRFFTHPKMLALAENCRANDATFHIMGLVQDAGVHAYITHLFAAVDFAKREKLPRVAIHFFSDGRDTEPMVAHRYYNLLKRKLSKVRAARVETVSGRYYAMDRDTRWERVRKAYDALVRPGEAKTQRFSDAEEYIRQCHKKGIGDEFIPPAAREGYAGMAPQDSVLFFNYRQDRAIQPTKALIDPGFRDFPVKNLSLKFVGLTRYYDTFTEYLIPPFHMDNTLGEVLSKAGLRQLRITETEKFKHLTSFLNGKVEAPFGGEDRILIPSPRVATYDLLPEMRTREITDEVERLLLRKRYDVVFINYACPDMVGHTGKMPAIVRAVESVDEAVGRVVHLALEQGGACIVTSDHGDCEEKVGKYATSHTMNPVQCTLVSPLRGISLRERGILADIAPTMLELLGIPKPKEMTAESLLAWRASAKHSDAKHLKGR